jgi:hypothetical protein
LVHAVAGGLGVGDWLGLGLGLGLGFCSSCCDGAAPDGGVPGPDVPHANNATMAMQNHHVDSQHHLADLEAPDLVIISSRWRNDAPWASVTGVIIVEAKDNLTDRH